MKPNRIFSILLNLLVLGIVLIWGYFLFHDFQTLQTETAYLPFAIFNIKILLFALFLIVSVTTLFYINTLEAGKNERRFFKKSSPFEGDYGYKIIMDSIDEMKEMITEQKIAPITDPEESSELVLTDKIEMMQKFLETENLQELLSMTVKIISKELHAGRISIFLCNSEKSKLIMVKNIGFHNPLEPSQIKQLEINAGLAWDVFKKGKRMYVTNIESHPETGKRNKPQYKGKSFMIFPIRLFKNEIYGVINITEKQDNNLIFTVNDLRMTSYLVSIFSQKLENIILYDSVKELLNQFKNNQS